VAGFRDVDGSVPILTWLHELPARAEVKCRLKIERLAELGHELRRPEADYLRDGIYELRATLQGRHYRMLYFFLGRTALSSRTGSSRSGSSRPGRSTWL
jgi:hypothetical protein